MNFIITSSKKEKTEKLAAKLRVLKSGCTITYIENGWYFSQEDGILISYDKTRAISKLSGKQSNRFGKIPE